MGSVEGDSFLHHTEIQEMSYEAAIAFLENIRDRRTAVAAKAERSRLAVQRTGKKDANISMEELYSKLQKAETSLENAIKKYEEVVRKMQVLALEVT